MSDERQPAGRRARLSAFRVRNILRNSSTFPGLCEGRRVARHLGCEEDTGFALAWATTPDDLQPTLWRGGILLALSRRFGSVSPAVEARVRAENDAARLRAALYGIVNLAGPDELAL